jgi:heme-degrading monooxygenase HmoA
MIAVIFEVWAEGAHRDEYLAVASRLKSELVRMDGFVSIERFESLAEPGKILSLSFWRDEEAVAAWRNLESHRAAQREGRAHVFADYRLRVANVLRDYGMAARDQVPSDSRAVHDHNE